MPRKKTKSKRTGRSKASPSKPGSKATPILQLLLVSLVAALALIAVIVLLTPLPEDDPSGATTLATEANLPQDAAGEEVQPQSLETVANNRSKPQTLRVTPEEIEVEALQAELEALATSLPEKYPDEVKAHHVAAQIYAEFDRTAQAIDVWKRCVAMQPRSPGPFVGLAELYMANGDNEDAASLLGAAKVSGVQSVELIESLARAYENQGQLERADGELTQGVKTYPESSELWAAAGRVQNQLNTLPAAEASLRKAMQLGDQTRENLVLLAMVLARQKKTEEAAQVRAQLAQREPTSPPESAPASNERFQVSLDTTTREFAYHMFLASGAIAEHHGDLAEAERLMRRAQAVFPAGSQSYVSLSAIYRRQAKPGAALVVQRRLLEIQPENLVNYTNLANLALQVGDVLLAEQTLKDAVESVPEGTVAQHALVRLYLSKGSLAEALQLASETLDRHRSVESYMLLASVYGAAGDLAAAEATISEARKLNPSHPLLQNATTAPP